MTQARTLGDFFLKSEHRFPDRKLIHGFFDGKKIELTYQETLLRVHAAATQMSELGLKRGDHLVCYAEEMIPSILMVLASAIIGVIPVPLSPLFSVELLSRLMAQVGAKEVFSTPDRLDALLEKSIRPLCLRLRENEKGDAKWIDLFIQDKSNPRSIEKARKWANENLKTLTSEDPYLIIPTSGTTGTPKLIVRPHRTLINYARIAMLGRNANSAPPQRILMVAALTHGFGSSLLAPAMALGAELAVTSRIDLNASLEEVRALDPTFIAVTPRVLRSFHRQHLARGGKEEERLFGPNAKALWSGGSSPDVHLLKAMKGQGLEIYEFYGSGEVSIIVLTPPDGWKEGFVGKAVEGVELKLAEDGELLAKSPGQMLEYLGDEEQTRDAFTEDGFYKMGDIAAIDPTGYVKILGRKKDIFNTPEGSNIFPGPIETLIEALPGVSQVILIGDQLPFITAYVTLNSEMLKADSPQIIPLTKGLGYLDPVHHSELYQQISDRLSEVNQKLEKVEKTVGFAILHPAFPKELYAPVGHGKVRRDRPLAKEAVSDLIRTFYRSPAEGGLSVSDPRWVSNFERRLRPRQ